MPNTETEKDRDKQREKNQSKERQINREGCKNMEKDIMRHQRNVEKEINETE